MKYFAVLVVLFVCLLGDSAAARKDDLKTSVASISAAMKAGMPYAVVLRPRYAPVKCKLISLGGFFRWFEIISFDFFSINRTILHVGGKNYKNLKLMLNSKDGPFSPFIKLPITRVWVFEYTKKIILAFWFFQLILNRLLVIGE